MNEEMIFGLAGMFAGIIVLALIAVLVVNLMKVWQTKIKTAKEEVYQNLAADAIEAQKQSAQQQEKLATEMAEVKERLVSIDKMLKEVE